MFDLLQKNYSILSGGINMKLIVDIQVNDLQRAVNFYRDTLELNCRIVEEDWAGIAVGDAEIHLYTNGGVTGGVEFYVDDIDAYVDRFMKNGVVFISGMGKPDAQSVDENNITTFPWGRSAFFKRY